MQRFSPSEAAIRQGQTEDYLSRFFGGMSFVLSVNLSLGVNPIVIATNAHAEIPETPDSIRLVQLSLGRRYLIVSRIGVKQSRQ